MIRIRRILLESRFTCDVTSWLYNMQLFLFHCSTQSFIICLSDDTRCLIYRLTTQYVACSRWPMCRGRVPVYGYCSGCASSPILQPMQTSPSISLYALPLDTMYCKRQAWRVDDWVASFPVHPLALYMYTGWPKNWHDRFVRLNFIKH